MRDAILAEQGLTEKIPDLISTFLLIDALRWGVISLLHGSCFIIVMSTIPDQYKGAGYGTIYSDSEARQAIANAEVAKLIGGGSSGGGSTDPAAPNAVELSDGTNYYKALSEGTPATGVTGPTGGSGGLKWLSGIWDLINNVKALLPSTLMGDRFKVDGSGVTQPVSGTVAISNSSLEISNDVGNPVPVSGTVAISNSSIEIANDVGNAIPISAASLPLPSGASTSALQTTGNTSLTSIDGKLPSTLASDRLKVDGSGVTQPVSGTVAVSNTEFLAYLEAIYNTTLPTITNGSKANLQLSSRGELLTSFVDFVSAVGNITAADAGSISTPGADSQAILSGTPTANSFVSVPVSGDSSFAIQVDGTFVGTLQFERSLDGGSTYTAISALVAGSPYSRSTTTQIGRWHGNCSSSNSLRVRAIAWTSGTANVRILAGAGTGTITIGNPIRLFDQITGVQASIKGANVAGLGSDNAIVTTTRFNQFAAETQLTAPGTTQSLDVSAYTRVHCQYVIGNINTNVVVRLEGSNDGTNWSNLAQGEVDTTRTVNGVYSFITTAPLFRVRFNFVSESGGTAATIDVRFTAN